MRTTCERTGDIYVDPGRSAKLVPTCHMSESIKVFKFFPKLDFSRVSSNLSLIIVDHFLHLSDYGNTLMSIDNLID